MYFYVEVLFAESGVIDVVTVDAKFGGRRVKKPCIIGRVRFVACDAIGILERRMNACIFQVFKLVFMTVETQIIYAFNQRCAGGRRGMTSRAIFVEYRRMNVFPGRKLRVFSLMV